MDIKGKYESKLQKTALSCDAFTTGYFIMFLLFFVPYVAMAGDAVVVWFLPIACLIPFAVAPLFYMLVHRMDILLFGRYHLVMPLSAFISALFFVLMFAALKVSAAGSCLIFFGLAVFATFIAVYKYCAFSVRTRLDGAGFADFSLLYFGFSVFGGALAIAAFVGFWFGGSESAFLDTAYVMAGLNTVAALVQYLTSYYDIPRLSGKRVLSIKSVFRTFYYGINKRVYFSTLLFISAFAVICSLIVYFGLFVLSSVYVTAGIAVVIFVCYTVSTVLCKLFIKYRSIAISAFNFVCFVLAAILLVAVAASHLRGAGAAVLVLIAAAFSGVGGATTARQTVLRFVSVKPGATSGVVYLLTVLTAFAAVAIALSIAACIITAGNTYAFICGFVVAVALSIAAIALSRKKSGSADGAPKLSYEITASETDEKADRSLPVAEEQDNQDNQDGE